MLATAMRSAKRDASSRARWVSGEALLVDGGAVSR